jgi:phosphoribosyl 1,2-cyclic phosphodiesterase
LRIHLAGVRGSTPAPGAEFVRVGGHTSCVAVLADGDDAPRLVLDAGTGLRRVAGLLDGGPFRGTILLTHLHWDHTQGLPFFTSADRADADTTLVMPDQGDPVEVLGRAMSPPHFPIGPEGQGGTWTFRSIDAGRHEVEGFQVDAFEVPHKGGRTFGYRVTDGDRSLAYLPDHLPDDATHDDVVARVGDVDLLVHDAQFTDAEAALARAYGHATIDQAVGLARDAGARELLLFHHAPGRDDDAVDGILAAARGIAGPDGPLVTCAREGDTLAVGAPDGVWTGRTVARQH